MVGVELGGGQVEDLGGAVSQWAYPVAALKLNYELIKLTSGGGKNSPGLLKARIKFVEDYI